MNISRLLAATMVVGAGPESSRAKPVPKVASDSRRGAVSRPAKPGDRRPWRPLRTVSR
jgi:hypothetical protein